MADNIQPVLSTNPGGDNTRAGEVAATNNYSGDAFRAGAVNEENPVLAATPMTDYRGVDTGLTSVGSTDQNADMASMGALGVAGVRVGSDVPGQQSGGVESGPADSRGDVDMVVEAGHGDDRDDKIGGINLNDPSGPPEIGSASTTPATGLTAAAYPGAEGKSRGIVEKISDAVTGHNK